MTIADGIYALCAATSLMAAWLLLRHYLARRTPLLLPWSCFAFFGLAVNNVLLLIDLAFLTNIDLALPRTLAAAAALVTLVYGLIRETGS